MKSRPNQYIIHLWDDFFYCNLCHEGSHGWRRHIKDQEHVLRQLEGRTQAGESSYRLSGVVASRSNNSGQGPRKG